jgi:hypothetical protein
VRFINRILPACPWSDASQRAVWQRRDAGKTPLQDVLSYTTSGHMGAASKRVEHRASGCMCSVQVSVHEGWHTHPRDGQEPGARRLQLHQKHQRHQRRQRHQRHQDTTLHVAAGHACLAPWTGHVDAARARCILRGSHGGIWQCRHARGRTRVHVCTRARRLCTPTLHADSARRLCTP